MLLDSNLKPWLLEVNVSPSLHSSSLLDETVKAHLVHDTLNIVGFHIPAVGKKVLGAPNVSCYDNRIYSTNITNTERYKHFTFISKPNRNDYLDRILNELTPDDVRQLITHEDEQSQLGSFQKIFPTHETHPFLKYLEKKRYYNLLLDAWETKYHNCREKGIQLIREYCQNRVHLRVPRRQENVKLII